MSRKRGKEWGSGEVAVSWMWHLMVRIKCYRESSPESSLDLIHILPVFATGAYHEHIAMIHNVAEGEVNPQDFQL